MAGYTPNFMNPRYSPNPYLAKIYNANPLQVFMQSLSQTLIPIFQYKMREQMDLEAYGKKLRMEEEYKRLHPSIDEQRWARKNAARGGLDPETQRYFDLTDNLPTPRSLRAVPTDLRTSRPIGLSARWAGTVRMQAAVAILTTSWQARFLAGTLPTQCSLTTAGTRRRLPR